MKIDIKGTHLELTDAIKDHVYEKIGSLDKYFDNIIDAKVEVGKPSEHHHKGDIFRAEVNLNVPGKMLRAESTSDDLYKAINEVKDAMQQEIKKFKEKLRERA